MSAMVSEILVLATGGTVASSMSESGASPTHDIDHLLDTVPSLGQKYSIRTEQFSKVSSSNMSLDTVAKLSRRIETAAADGVDGTVVVNGTDTMEESAYFFDLLDRDPMPIVLTGAQRRPDEVSSDGAANLLASIQAAGDEMLYNTDGVYICFNNRLYAARDVMKLHTSNLDTFRSPGKGPVAELTHTGFRFNRSPESRSATIARPDDIPVEFPRVEIIKSGLDIQGRQMISAIERGTEGLVVEGTGLGNVSPGIAKGIKKALDSNIPVVLTSRCIEGDVAPVYGTTGGGKVLNERGVILGGDLSSHKSRIKLILTLTQASNRRKIDELFDNSVR